MSLGGEKTRQFATEESFVSAPSLDPHNVPFEEYLYHAAAQRRAEEAGDDENHTANLPAGNIAAEQGLFHRFYEKKGANVDVQVKAVRDDYSDLTPDEVERVNASRALRRASWAAVFYLITTEYVCPLFPYE